LNASKSSGLRCRSPVRDGRRVQEQTWQAVDAYIEQVVGCSDEVLEAALAQSAAAGLLAISVSPAQGKLLHLLARAIGARRVLEVGTLGGYSAIWLARALPPGGRLVTLELSEHHAQVARDNLARAGLADVVDVLVGPATDTLAGLQDDVFDLVFIDADKPSNSDYVRAALRLTHPGSVIVVDNVVRGGAVLDADGDESVQGVRRLNDLLMSEPRLSATTIQTVGAKGYDGFTLALVVSV
jgi:predicted O-methyltransferase YrrM